MAGQRAVIGGIAVSAIAPIRWRLTTGTQPYTTVVEVHESEAKQILNRLGRSVDIRVHGDGGFTIKQVYVIAEAPSSAPFYKGIVLADARWKWNRTHVRRRYNHPRRTGNKHMQEGGPAEITPITDDFTYAKWSLYNGTKKWTASRMLLDIADRVCSAFGGKFALVYQPPDELPIEDLFVNDPGDAALDVAMAKVPGCDVYVDYDGKAIFYNARDLAAAKKLLGDMTPAIQGSQIPALVTQRHLRPEAIEVLFDREVEIRFNSKAEGDGSTPTADANDNQREMINVLPLPDLELVVGGHRCYRGQWVRIEDVIEAWSRDLPDDAPPITFENIRKFWFGGRFSTWAELGKLSPDGDFVMRMAALAAHYRKTYQLPRKWMDRILSLRNYRVAVVDPVTGTRAPGLIQTNYCVQTNDRAKVAQKSADVFHWLNVEGYPTDDLVINGRPAPAVATILDEDLGVIHVEFVRDPLGLSAAIHPSQCENEAGEKGTPTFDLRRTSLRKFSPIRDGKVKGSNGGIRLSATHKLLVILTAAPGAPNNERQLHKIKVKPSEVAGMLPGAGADGTGPVWQVHVPASIYTARFMWDDSIAEKYTRLFGFNSDSPDDAGIDSEELGGEMFQNEAECKKLAKAAAAAVYSRMADHIEGSLTVHVKDGIEPAGNVNAVEHSLDPDGLLTTTAIATPALKPKDLFAFLDDRTRAIILGTVQFKNAP